MSAAGRRAAVNDRGYSLKDAKHSLHHFGGASLVQEAGRLKTRRKRFLFRPLLFGLLSGGLAVLACAFLALRGAFPGWDAQAEDFWVRIRGGLPANPKIILIAADEASQSALNQQWPWPRSLHARLVDRLTAAGAKVIALDLIFAEDGRDAEADRQLADAIRRSGRCVLASFIDQTRVTDAAAGVTTAPERLVRPRPQFAAAAVGFVNVEESADGIIRTFPPVQERFETPAFSVAVVQKYLGSSDWRRAEDGGVHVGALTIPAAPAVRYVGPPGAYRTFSYFDVVDDEKFALLNQAVGVSNAVHDAIVLVGCTLRDQKDYFRHPFGDTVMTGLEVHANIVQTILDGAYTQRAPALLLVALVLVLGFSTVTAMLWLRGWLALSTAGLVLVAFQLLDFYALAGMNVVIPWSYPTLAIVSGYFVTGAALRLRIKLAEMLGPYKLLGELGKGGMAVVYRAKHKRSQEIVALKVMLPHLADVQDNVLRFYREMSVAANLQHPNIVRILDVGEVGGQPYCAMELVDGHDLHHLLQQQSPLPPAEAVRLGLEIADALHTAHEKGVVHRDVKPSNVMITRDGASMIMDFGLAFATGQTALTMSGAILGTPDYMAPEQCRGEHVGRQADIYSFGCVLYLMLTGKPVFTGETPIAVMQHHLNTDPEPLRARAPGVPAELEAIVMKCLAKQAADRYATMAEVREALKKAAESLPQVPRATGTRIVNK